MKTRIITLGLIIISLTIYAQEQHSVINYKGRDLITFDLSNLSWINAYDSLHAIMTEKYPYTDWKEIEWDEKNAFTQPMILEAQNNTDTIELTEALYEYLYSIPDGHVMYRGDVSAFRQDRQAGSFGLNMIPITNGKIIANIVPEGGPAFLVGIRCGDEIVNWNGSPILEVPELEVYNNYGGVASNYATEEGRMIGRYEVLARSPLGAMVEVTYISYATGSQHTVTLTAEADDYTLWLQAYFLTKQIPNFDTVVTYKILDEQIGYLSVLMENGDDSLTLEEIRLTEDYLKVKEAITSFNEQNIDKLIFDLRFNAGGNDLMGSAISGFFYETESFYEYITGTSDVNYVIVDSIITQPETPYFSGEVVVILGPNCISTGEGIPMMLQRLPNAQVISFWGSNGSFGIVPYVIYLPNDQYILLPYARSLDENQVIQLDSDAGQIGGVQPDIKIPLTVERVIEQWGEGKDVEMEYAINLLLGVEEFVLENPCKIYPNPASDQFTVECPDMQEITLISTSGQTILHKKLGGVSSFQLSTSNLPQGLFLCRILSEREVYQHRVLIIN